MCSNDDCSVATGSDPTDVFLRQDVEGRTPMEVRNRLIQMNAECKQLLAIFLKDKFYRFSAIAADPVGGSLMHCLSILPHVPYLSY